MPMSRTFNLSITAIEELVRWWQKISSETASGNARADRAVLRRAANIDAVVLSSAYQRVHAEMAKAHNGRPWQDWENDRVAVIVGLAAHLKENVSLSLPEAMSYRREGSDRNPVSELRFRRLLESPDIDTLFSGLRRILPLINHAVDLRSLSRDVFGWGDGVKKRWAYAYNWSKKSET